MKYKIDEYALSLGADDVRFVDASPVESGGEGLIRDPSLILKGAACVILLFFRYTPTLLSDGASMNVSQYYLRSHRGYLVAKEVEKRINAIGFEARLDSRLPAAAYARKLGGVSGQNGLYFHERLGSTVEILTIVSNLPAETESGGVLRKCVRCGRCADACPMGAISWGRVDYEKCLRTHMYGLVPIEMRTKIYQLFGCELCQAACPMNFRERVAPLSFPVTGLLAGEHTKELARLTGVNTARRNRIISLACLYAGANRLTGATSLLCARASSDVLIIREHARWALNRFINKA